MPPSLSVVIPMFNEREYIRRSVGAALAVLGPTAPDHEIVIVNDASTDDTGAIADELAAADPRIRVVHNQRNLTLGGSLRAGFAAARKQLVFYTDADLPFDFEQLPRALRLLELHEADVLSGYRFDRTAEGWRRALYTLGYSALVRLLFGLRLRDVNCSFKLIRRELLQRLPLKSEGSFIDAELLIRTARAGGRIIQIGLDYFPRTRGSSTLATPGVIVRILREMAALSGELRRLR